MPNDITDNIKSVLKDVKKEIKVLIENDDLSVEQITSDIKKLFMQSAKKRGIPNDEFIKIASLMLVLVSITHPVTIK